MPAGKMKKVGFAAFFMVAVLGAVLLLISQVPVKKEYYDVVDTRSFSVGEPMTFYWTFEANAKYRFEVKGVNWTSRTMHHIMVGNDTSLSASPARDQLYSWDWNQEVTCAYNVTFYRYDYSDDSQHIELATTTSASVEISQYREMTYHLTYLIYVGLPLLIAGAILIMITGKDVDSRMRMPDTSARS